MLKSSVKVLTVGALATAGILVMMPKVQAEPPSLQSPVVPEVQEKVVFACEMQNGQYVTVQKYIRRTEDPSRYPVVRTEVLTAADPMMTWTATLDSDHPLGAYTPESRCKAVSARLTNLAASLGVNTPDKIALLGQSSLNGVVNHERVVFSHYKDQPASRENVIFTLKPGNRPMRSIILTKFRVGTAGSVGGASLSPSELPPIVE